MRTRKAKNTNPSGANDATVGYEAELWRMANALRGSMDAAEYKHVVLGLIFLKYISDAFEEHRAHLLQEPYADPEDPDEYRAQNIFWVPPEARWERLQAHARQPNIGQIVDEAMEAVERDNPSLKGVLPKDYARPSLDKQRLGQLIDLVSNIKVGDREARAKDVLGRVYEYFLSQFASAEGKKGGGSSTPPGGWSASWWRCSNPSRAASTTPAAARQVCSSSRWSSSRPTPPATATETEPRPRSAFTARSSTTPPGAWPR